MGHHADRGILKKNGGTEAYNMDDMRASAGRLSPTSTDVDMQIT